MSYADLLPWLNLLLPPALAVLVSINSKLAAVQATQDAHAEQLRALRAVPPLLAAVAAVQTEHARSLDHWRSRSTKTSA